MVRPGQNGIWKFDTRRAAVAGVTVAIIFVLAVVAAQGQTYQVIHNFAGGLDGSEPTSGVTSDAAGNLYGTTFEGDALTGTVYRLTHKASSWVLMPLYLFPYEGSGGSIPYARVIFGKDGSLYGTTAFGGNLQGCSGGCGAVFNMKPTPNPPITPLTPWIETPLYRFAGGNDGANPYGADIIFDQAGTSMAPPTTVAEEVAPEVAARFTSSRLLTAVGQRRFSTASPKAATRSTPGVASSWTNPATSTAPRSMEAPMATARFTS